MVALSPNFAVLASFAVLAATLLSPVTGVAIPSSPYRSQSDRQSGEAAKFDKHHSGSASSAQSQSAATKPEQASAGGGLPLPIPLPSLGRRVNVASQPALKRWDPLDPLLEVGGIYIGDNPNHGAATQSEAFTATSANSRVHTTSERVHTVHDPSEEGVHMVITGSNEHIHVDRSPEPHRHHHDDGRHSNVIVSGSNDEVHMNEKRTPRHHHHGSHRYHNYHWKRDTNSSSQPLVDPTGTILVPFGKRGVGHEKREGGGLDGVPGIIDIVSSVAGSSRGQRVASLVLAPAINGVNASDPFVLNASGTNKTQVYLIVLDDDDSSPSTFNPGRQTNSRISGNSTMPSNSTSADNSTAPAARSFDDSASVSLGASASISSDSSAASSNSTSPLKRVALQIPVFDPEEAVLKAFCATFDPQPSAPSPLTVESCSEGVLEADHKSQVFAYDPNTGIIQPMWFNGDDDKDDGSSGSAASDDGSSATSAPAASESTASADGVDASADVGAAVARLNSLNRELIGDASGGHNFAARDSYNAQNVTLVFSPLAPVLPQPDTPSEAQAVDSSASSSSSDISTATYSSSSATSTASDSLVSSAAPSSAVSSTASDSSTSSDSMPSATFAPAAVASSDPTDSSSDSVSSTASSGSSAAFSSASATGSVSAVASTTDSAATPTSSAHGLGVEVFDPSAETSTTSSDASSGSTIPANSSSTSVASSDSSVSSATASASSGSAAPSMTPASTSPYEWMFRETARKN